MVAASARTIAAITAARAGQPFPKWVRTAAVGSSTAAALRDAGAWSVLVGRGGADDLIPMLRDADQWERCRVLVPRAAEGRRDLAAALRVLGARVDEVVAYRTRPRPSAEIEESFRLLRPDAVVVASPSAARALVAALGARALRSLAAVVAMGPTTASTLAGLGVSSVVSERTDFASLAERTRSALAFAHGAIAAGEEI
jgi:uroporphyrinogen-III synthase